METSTPLAQTKDIREYRRFRAYELVQQGWTQTDIAQALGVTQGAISQWMKRAREGGLSALRKRTPPGATPRLSQEQKASLPALLEQGAQAYGFYGDFWHCARIAQVIEAAFGVRYHPSHVRRILKQIGWSVQKPVRQASQRPERAIADWQAQRWPALKRGPSKTDAR